MTRYDDDDQRMTVTIAHARLNCVYTDTEVTAHYTLVE